MSQSSPRFCRWPYVTIILALFTPVERSLSAPLIFEYRAVATSVSGVWLAGGQVGDTVVGRFVFDGDVVEGPSSIGNPEFDRFEAGRPGNQGLAWELSASLGNVAFSTVNNAQPSLSNHHTILVWDTDSEDLDRFDFFAERAIDSDDRAEISLVDLVKEVDGQIILADAIRLGFNMEVGRPPSFFDVDLFERQSGRYEVYGDNGEFQGLLTWSFDSITLVPAPAAIWLFASALSLAGWIKRRVP